MKNQELAFTSNEGDNWFIRNKSKIKENSAEISLLCNWLMPYQNQISTILEIGSGPGNKLAQICWQFTVAISKDTTDKYFRFRVNTCNDLM